jgi:hypothetical protein
MKVMIGWADQEHGTVEVTPAGLVYGGPTPAHVLGIVEDQRHWYDRAGVLHLLQNDELVRSLPYRMHGLLWAVFMDKQGAAQHQPPYDPWGNMWRSEEIRQ